MLVFDDFLYEFCVHRRSNDQSLFRRRSLAEGAGACQKKWHG
jgi:hypothetical protein